MAGPAVTRRRILEAALELLDEAPDADLEAEQERDAAALEKDFGRERTALLFSGEHDERSANPLDPRRRRRHRVARLGGDAPAHVPALVRHHGFKTEVLDSMMGEEAGIKSVTVEVQGADAYGYLRASAVCIASCASARSTPSTAATRPSPSSR